jgi:formiminotetrahydrofolate cyclodeaminase
MSSYKLPKQSDEEKSARARAIQETTIAATRAPLTAAADAVAGLELAERAAVLAKGNVVSDVGAGAALLGGAVAAVLLNVDINLPGLSDATRKEEFGRQRTTLAERASALAATVLAKVNSRITSGK